MSLLARQVGARVVADGVESAADLDALTAVGIDLVQGHLLSPPLSAAELAGSQPGVTSRPARAS